MVKFVVAAATLSALALVVGAALCQHYAQSQDAAWFAPSPEKTLAWKNAQKNAHEQCLLDAGRFCGYVERPESHTETSKAKTLIEPDLRLQYHASSLEGAWAINSGILDYPGFAGRYVGVHVPDMGFGQDVERCLVIMSCVYQLVPPCSEAILQLDSSINSLQTEYHWYWNFLNWFFQIGLYLTSNVYLKKMKGFKEEHTLRQDVLRTIYSDTELKFKVEQALGVELSREAMLMDSMASYKKRLGCIGMFCIHFLGFSMVLVFFIACAMIPLANAILMPANLCVSFYGFVMFCCCSPKLADEESQDDFEQSLLLAYPAASHPLFVPGAALEAVHVVL